MSSTIALPRITSPLVFSSKSCFHRAILSFSPPSSSLVLFLWLPVSQFCITNVLESGKSLIPLRGQRIDGVEQKPAFSSEGSRGVARAVNTHCEKVCSVLHIVTLTSVAGT